MAKGVLDFAADSAESDAKGFSLAIGVFFSRGWG